MVWFFLPAEGGVFLKCDGVFVVERCKSVFVRMRMLVSSRGTTYLWIDDLYISNRHS